MRQDGLVFGFGSFFCLVVIVVFWAFSARPAVASCAGGGFSVDLVATGMIEDIVATQTSSRIEVRVDRVLLGDRDKSGETLFIKSDSGLNEGSSVDVSFREGARYELYLQGEGDEWKTNICLGTRELTGPPQTVASSPGAEASPDYPIMPETGGPGVLTVAALAGLLVLGIGAVVWRWVR